MEFSFKSLFSGFDWLGKGKNSVLGIDIGTAFIKIIQLRKEKERAILETYGEIALGPYANLKIGQAAKLPEAIIVEALKDVLKESNANAKNAVVSIPLQSSFVTMITLPFMPDKNAAEVLQMEARRYIPIPISEVVFDWWILPDSVENEESDENNPPAGGLDEIGKKPTQILLAAIHKDTINDYKSIMPKVNLKAKAYEIESFSMVRSSASRESSPVAVIDFGASTTKLAIVDGGLIKSSHSVSHGSQELTLALSHALSIDFERAEEMKREIGLSDLPEHAEVVTVFEPILDYIFMEANNFIKNFQKKYRRSVGKIILTGGGALLKGLVDFSVKKFTIEVEIADPFSKTEHPAFLVNALKDAGPNFSIALGLALREL